MKALDLLKDIQYYKKLISNYEKRKLALEAKKTLLEAESEVIKNYNKSKIAEIENLKDINKNLTINLIAAEIKPNLWQRLTGRVFKFDGYIGYLNPANELKIYKVKNFKDFYETNGELYGLKEKIGVYNKKPIFLIKYPTPISLDINSDVLQFDSVSFYNFHNKLTKRTLTNWGGSLGLGDFLRKNFILILIALALILLFTTPQGKEFLAGIMPKTAPG